MKGKIMSAVIGASLLAAGGSAVADENSPMSHYAFAGIRNGQSSTWLEEVKD